MPADATVHRSLETEAAPNALEQVHATLAALWAEVVDLDPMDRMAFDTAVAEVAANIVSYCGGPAFFALDLDASADRVVAEFRDDGTELPPGTLEGAVMPDDLLAEHGRGLAIARAALDELSYRRTDGINHWRLVKQRG